MSIREEIISRLVAKINENPDYYVGAATAGADAKHIGCLLTDSGADGILSHLEKDHEILDLVALLHRPIDEP